MSIHCEEVTEELMSSGAASLLWILDQKEALKATVSSLKYETVKMYVMIDPHLIFRGSCYAENKIGVLLSPKSHN